VWTFVSVSIVSMGGPFCCFLHRGPGCLLGLRVLRRKGMGKGKKVVGSTVGGGKKGLKRLRGFSPIASVPHKVGQSAISKARRGASNNVRHGAGMMTTTTTATTAQGSLEVMICAGVQN
jgi:hypothetical protein